jgi:hypothetical protein
MALVSTQYNAIKDTPRQAWGTRTGTRSAADFIITTGFDPKYIKVINLTDRIEFELIVDSNLTANQGLLTIANGTRTYVTGGVSISGKGFAVDVSSVSLETDNDHVVWFASE